MDRRDEQADRRKIEKYKYHPMANFSDAINRSMVGDIGQMTKGSCLTRIITTVTIILISFLIFKYS